VRTEDTLFGNGVVLQVQMSWSAAGVNLYLNNTLVKSIPYTVPAPNWTAASLFDLGAFEYFTYGGYSISTTPSTNSPSGLCSGTNRWFRKRIRPMKASAGRHVMLRNELPRKRNWLELELTGVESNRDAVGARVTIRIASKLQMREVELGDGYGSQNTLRQHFGLGDVKVIDEMVVR
jgi:hypothetical protein